jgi:hypothetical protein
VVAGQKKKPGEKLTVGSVTAWMLDDPAAKWGYLEFSGQGLTALVQNLEKKEQYMAVLGARMLEELKKGVEAADTAAIHRAGEQSVLASIALMISLGMTNSLNWFAAWAGIPGTVTFGINRDFLPTPMDPIALAQLVAAWQQSAISYVTLFENIKRMGIVPDDRQPEEELASIEAAPPTLVMDQLQAQLDTALSQQQPADKAA